LNIKINKKETLVHVSNLLFCCIFISEFESPLISLCLWVIKTSLKEYKDSATKPSTNGLAERYVQIIKNYLSKTDIFGHLFIRK
jgi:hypothetical protein